MSADEATVAPARRPQMPTWLVATIAGFFGLFYAYAVWGALDFLVLQAGGTFGLTPLGWFVLLFAVVFPILVFAGAFALGWRRPAWQFALLLLAGLGLSAVLWLNVLAMAATSFSLYGG